MTVDVSQVVARQIHSRLGCHRRRFHREWATPEQTAYITGINKAILYSVFRHYCEGGSGPTIWLASEKHSERAFLCLAVYREFVLDASKTASFSVFIILYAVRDAQIEARCLLKITDDGSRQMIIHVCMRQSNLNADLNTCESGVVWACMFQTTDSLVRPRGPVHIAGRQSTFILERVKLNI